jgi:hypothetical protein
LNPVRTESIIGMTDEEALDLVAELMEHATEKNTNTGTSGTMVALFSRTRQHHSSPGHHTPELVCAPKA